MESTQSPTDRPDEMPSHHISVVVDAEPGAVYRYAADIDNLPRWAAGLASGVRRDGTDAVAASPFGEVRVRFAPLNDFGVLDHDVTLPDGTVVNNPLRVLHHPDGAEVIFTVRRLDATEEQFADDCAAVRDDLRRLRALVEARSVGQTNEDC
ncbi:SRPBCC family protein [Williamsia sterculiae]|uniref:Polyketide cyclase / dehydrase and lipid transport n=1 Tax=Williamsia sterculiae TaxID=1344003 RepID=A0A1N7H3K0_9NOCA|nr:SRPBCC family protein [Williamsia sterculiae]SIS19340.1 hypothetical protein SAMN05445060_3464 [Williamsia sterculiae]